MNGSERGSGEYLWRWLPLAVAPLLLYLAFRRIEMERLVGALANLNAAKLSVLAVVNLTALAMLSMRWWLILRALGHAVPYFVLSLYRLVGFGWSYFTPGPQFGGEPWQIHLLESRSGLRSSEATASVGLEKSVELIANFSFLLFGLLVVLQLGLFPGGSVRPLLVGAAVLLAIPIGLLWFARRGHRPFAWFLGGLPADVRAWPRIEGLIGTLEEAEILGADFLGRNPRTLIVAVLASLGTWAVLAGEYWLMARYLGLELTVWTAIAALTAARLAYLLPMPGGLGTLEASQVLALAALGHPLEAGAALALLIRARDVLFGGIGLVMGGVLAPGAARREV